MFLLQASKCRLDGGKSLDRYKIRMRRNWSIGKLIDKVFIRIFNECSAHFRVPVTTGLYTWPRAAMNARLFIR
jgi:hypothetical protein